MADEQTTPKRDKAKDADKGKGQGVAQGQNAEPGTSEHLGSDRPYEGAPSEDK